MSSQKKQGLVWIFIIAVISLVIHMLTFDTLGFHRDELLYLALGKHLAAGYWSNPPMIGFISYLSQLLPWDPLFNIRLIPAIAGAVLIILTGLISFELGGSGYSAILSCLILSFSLLILRGYGMFQPVPFDIFIWTLILYFFLKFLNTDKPAWIIVVGITTGLGMLNKYIVGFLIAGMLIAVLISRYRSLITKKYLWIAFLAAFIVFIPNLIWQFNHGFPVFIHMQELKETQLVNVERVNILIDQLLMFTIGSVVWVAGLFWLLLNGQKGKFRVFGLIYLAVLSIFLILKGKSYYMAGLYPFMFAAGGVAWESIFRRTAPRVVLAIVLFALSLPMLPAGVPVMKAPDMEKWFSFIPENMGGEALLRWEDGKMHSLPQDFADMLGWDEMADLVIKASDTIVNKERIMIYGENYGQAGAIDHFGEPYNLPGAASFSDSYFLWLPDSLDREKNILFYINDEPGEDIFPMFEKVDSVGSVTNHYAREFGTTVYFCRNPRPEFFDFFEKKVAEFNLFFKQPQ